MLTGRPPDHDICSVVPSGHRPVTWCVVSFPGFGTAHHISHVAAIAINTNTVHVNSAVLTGTGRLQLSLLQTGSSAKGTVAGAIEVASTTKYII